MTIAVVGKYTLLKDAYKSMIEALVHGGLANRVKVKLDWVEAESFEGDHGAAATRLEGVHGILVPARSASAARRARSARCSSPANASVPFFGVCFGMQMAVIEALRNVAGVTDATSTEFGPAANPAIGLMTEWTRDNQKEVRSEGDDMGGTMRLGSYEARLAAGSKIAGIYGATSIMERHRHRYEVNVNYVETLNDVGLKIAGMSPDGALPETVERSDHPWFIGVQYHPELKSRPFAPHPLYASFIAAAVEQSRLV